VSLCSPPSLSPLTCRSFRLPSCVVTIAAAIAAAIAAIIAATIAAVSASSLSAEFMQFIVQHGKSYNTVEEFEFRKALFA